MPRGARTHCTELRMPFSVSQAALLQPAAEGASRETELSRRSLTAGPSPAVALRDDTRKQRAAVPSYLYLWVLWPLDTQD